MAYYLSGGHLQALKLSHPSDSAPNLERHDGLSWLRLFPSTMLCWGTEMLERGGRLVAQ